MCKEGLYYLHENGALIYKRHDPGDLDESSFVIAWWPVDTNDRLNAWRIVLEAAKLGARQEDLKRLADAWHLTLKDSVEMLRRWGPPKAGMRRFALLVWGIRLEVWIAEVERLGLRGDKEDDDEATA